MHLYATVYFCLIMSCALYVQEETTPLWWGTWELVYFCQPDMTVGSHSDAEGGRIVPTTGTLGQIYRMCGGRERPQRFQLSRVGKNADWRDSRHGQTLPHSSSKSCAPPISTFKARQTVKHRKKYNFPLLCKMIKPLSSLRLNLFLRRNSSTCSTGGSPSTGIQQCRRLIWPWIRLAF